MRKIDIREAGTVPAPHPLSGHTAKLSRPMGFTRRTVDAALTVTAILSFLLHANLLAWSSTKASSTLDGGLVAGGHALSQM